MPLQLHFCPAHSPPMQCHLTCFLALWAIVILAFLKKNPNFLSGAALLNLNVLVPLIIPTCLSLWNSISPFRFWFIFLQEAFPGSLCHRHTQQGILLLHSMCQGCDLPFLCVVTDSFPSLRVPQRHEKAVFFFFVKHYGSQNSTWHIVNVQ